MDPCGPSIITKEHCASILHTCRQRQVGQPTDDDQLNRRQSPHVPQNQLDDIPFFTSLCKSSISQSGHPATIPQLPPTSISSIHTGTKTDIQKHKRKHEVEERRSKTEPQNNPAKSANGSLPCGCCTCCCCCGGCCGAPCMPPIPTIPPPVPVPTGLIGFGVDGSMICPNCDEGLDCDWGLVVPDPDPEAAPMPTPPLYCG